MAAETPVADDDKPAHTADNAAAQGETAGEGKEDETPAPQDDKKAEQRPAEVVDIDDVNPQDFQGEVQTNNDIPSTKTLSKIENHAVLDRHGKSHTFKSLYAGPGVARRVLVIFVRHFFCGSCQEFLRTLSESITPEALQPLSTSTSLVVVGCGDPRLIDIYEQETGCRFPVYTDPTRQLYDDLDMVRTLALGAHPAYLRKSMARNVFNSLIQTLKHVPSGLANKSGNPKQIGGEFLFEPLDGAGEAKEAEEKGVTWCHRMKTTRDHTEIPDLMQVLGIGA